MSDRPGSRSGNGATGFVLGGPEHGPTAALLASDHQMHQWPGDKSGVGIKLQIVYSEFRQPPSGMHGRDTLELDLPIAIRGQLLNLSDSEHNAVLSKLRQLADDPGQLGSDVMKSSADSSLWTVRLSGRMRALVRATNGQLSVLAVAPDDQLAPYLEPSEPRAA
jgi:hypothetical protein